MPTLARLVSVFVLIWISYASYAQSADTTILLQTFVIQFDSDQSLIKETYQSQIDEILIKSDSLQDIHAVIEAHTDDVGNADYNLRLSEERAQAIGDYLIKGGLGKDAIQFEYFGEEQLLQQSETEESRALNRRAILSIYYLKERPEPIAEFEGVEFNGRTIDSQSGAGVQSKVIVSGKNFKTETVSDSLGHFIAEVPDNAILKFEAFPNTPKYRPRMLMAKSTPNRLAEGIIIEMNGQELLQPKHTRILSGIVADEFEQPLANAMLKFQGKTVNDSLFTDKDGRFEIEIPERETVRLSAYFKDYFYDQKIISPISEKHVSEIKLELPKLEEGRRYVAGDILFVGNRDIVLPTSMINLQSLKEVVRLADDYCFKIEGHINLPGEGKVSRTSTNFKLSVDRAIRIYKFLRNNGIADERICYEGFGNWNMLYPKGLDARQQMLNRRVEVLVIPCE